MASIQAGDWVSKARGSARSASSQASLGAGLMLSITFMPVALGVVQASGMLFPRGR